MKTYKMKLRLNLLVLSLLLLSSTTSFAQNDTLKFLHITDLHLMFNLDIYDSVLVNHRRITREFDNSNANFKQFIKTIPKKTNSHFVIATGDLVDFYDAETIVGERLAYQVEQFARFIDKFYFPLFLTIGNHDIYSYDWGDDIITNQLQIAPAKATWIRNFNCFRNGTYYSRTYKIGKTNYRLIFLDNSYNKKVVYPYIDKAQLHWLRAELNKADNDIKIILMHIPFSDTSVLPESQNELYAELKQNPSVKLILAGHRHRNVISSYSINGGKEIMQVETSDLARDPNNWRLIQLTEDNIMVSVPGDKETELRIPLK